MSSRITTPVTRGKNGKQGGEQPASESAVGKLSKEQVLGAYRNALAARFIDGKILDAAETGEGVLSHRRVGARSGPGGNRACHEARARLGVSVLPRPCVLAPVRLHDRRVMLEALHRNEGPSSHGFAMPFHYGHKKWRIVAQSSPTGTQYLGGRGYRDGCGQGGERRSGLCLVRRRGHERRRIP